MRHFPRLFILVIAVAATLSLSACSIAATVDVSNAEDALLDAQRVGADYKAPFEYFMAQEMLRKAQEEWGYAEYYRSSTYAEKAMEFAEKARHKSESDPWQPPPPEVLGIKPKPGTEKKGEGEARPDTGTTTP